MKYRLHVLVFAGCILFAFGLAVFVFAWYPLGTEIGWSYIGGPGAQVIIEVPHKVRVTDSATVRVTYEFHEAPEFTSDGEIVIPDTVLDTAVGLRASGFSISPPGDEMILRHVKSGPPYDWIWSITPNSTGREPIILRFAGMSGVILAEATAALGVADEPANATVMSALNWDTDTIWDRAEDLDYVLSMVVPIEVVDVLGMTAIQARVVGIGAAVLGLGLLLSWLYLVIKASRSRVTSYDVDVHGAVQGLVIGDNAQVSQRFDRNDQ